MVRLQIPLTSDQLELLLAFEQVRGLSQLAEYMGRDASVISRNLQAMAETYPVIEKIQGRWEITDLGKKINRATQDFLKTQNQTLNTKPESEQAKPFQSSRALLMVINAQKGILNSENGSRSNPEAEKNIANLLEKWRKDKKSILHVKHISENPDSSFFKNSTGLGFMTGFEPRDSEFVLEKYKASAFSNSELKDLLEREKINTLILNNAIALAISL